MEIFISIFFPRKRFHVYACMRFFGVSSYLPWVMKRQTSAGSFRDSHRIISLNHPINRCHCLSQLLRSRLINYHFFPGFRGSHYYFKFFPRKKKNYHVYSHICFPRISAYLSSVIKRQTSLSQVVSVEQILVQQLAKKKKAKKNTSTFCLFFVGLRDPRSLVRSRLFAMIIHGRRKRRYTRA